MARRDGRFSVSIRDTAIKASTARVDLFYRRNTLGLGKNAMSLSIQDSGDQFRQRYLEQLAALQQRNQERLASGKKIARASDDSAGLAIARRLEASVSGAAQGERNVADGQSMVRVADASLETSQDTINRMRELTMQAQNGTMSATDRDTIQQEYDQLSAQLNQTASATTYGGKALLDGSVSGNNSMVIRDGSGGETNVEIADSSAQSLGIQGLDVSDPSTLSALDNARELVSGQRSNLGAVDNALSSQQSQLATARVNAEEARSRIEDVDVAKAVAESTRDRILMDMTIAGQRISDGSRSRVLDLLN
jgi:flagellin